MKHIMELNEIEQAQRLHEIFKERSSTCLSEAERACLLSALHQWIVYLEYQRDEPPL